MYIVLFYKLCEVIIVIYFIIRFFNDRVFLRLKKMINCFWIICKVREKWVINWVIFFLFEFILKLGNIFVLF